MTTYGESIAAVLNSDQYLLQILTGGIYYYPTLGRKGLTRLQTDAAYDPTTGLLKPVAVVVEGKELPDGQAVDGAGLYMSTVTAVYTWIYDHGDRGYGDIARAYSRIYRLLHCQQIPGAFQVLWNGTARDKREPDLKDACYFLADWRVHGFIDQTT